MLDGHWSIICKLKTLPCCVGVCHHDSRVEWLEGECHVQDFNMEIREALRGMLSHCRLGTKNCLNVLVVTLLENLRRYPDDKLSVWKWVTSELYPVVPSL